MDEHAKSSAETTLEPLSQEEDNFALAVIEYNGNLKAAYVAVFGAEIENPLARARILAARPSIAARIKQILFSAEENTLISTASHLAELAEIRDMAKNMNAVRIALEAEKSRGEVAGFYKTRVELPEGLNLELAKDAQALSVFVQKTMTKLADSLPV